MSVVFLDTETTGLYPERDHEIWEMAIVEEDGCQHEWHFAVDLAMADPMSLRIGRYYERRQSIPTQGLAAAGCLYRAGGLGEAWETDDPYLAAQSIAFMLDGVHIVGAVPSFDAAFLGPWLRRYDQAATWHYHLVDVEALAAGWVAARCMGQANDGRSRGTVPIERPDGSITNVDGRPPWRSEDLSRAVGVEPESFARHTALGDALWARAIYWAVMGIGASA